MGWNRIIGAITTWLFWFSGIYLWHCRFWKLLPTSIKHISVNGRIRGLRLRGRKGSPSHVLSWWGFNVVEIRIIARRCYLQDLKIAAITVTNICLTSKCGGRRKTICGGSDKYVLGLAPDNSRQTLKVNFTHTSDPWPEVGAIQISRRF